MRSSIVAERATTLFSFFKYTSEKQKATKKQLKELKPKKVKEVKRLYHSNKNCLLKASLLC